MQDDEIHLPWMGTNAKLTWKVTVTAKAKVDTETESELPAESQTTHWALELASHSLAQR